VLHTFVPHPLDDPAEPPATTTYRLATQTSTGFMRAVGSTGFAMGCVSVVVLAL